VFVVPIKEDNQNLVTILESFGEVTQLCTNFKTSSVVPIICGHINIDEILEGIMVARVYF
jgi:hypothetical protein